jgi:chitinase
MDMSPYTHIHLAFGSITTSWALDVSDIQIQWDLFKTLAGVKKILSLGGWSFSTEPATYTIFRDAVKPANQDTFVANIISFVQTNELDGIDFDWECELTACSPKKPSSNPSNRSRCTRYSRYPTRYVSFYCIPNNECVSSIGI